MKRVYNFSAGPSMLPLSVLEKAQSELISYGDSGMSVMEMSHRSAVYDEIIKSAEALLREIMEIPDNYKVLFLQGGASTQFAAVPLNLMNKNGKADYILSGQFTSASTTQFTAQSSAISPTQATFLLLRICPHALFQSPLMSANSALFMPVLRRIWLLQA